MTAAVHKNIKMFLLLSGILPVSFVLVFQKSQFHKIALFREQHFTIPWRILHAVSRKKPATTTINPSILFGCHSTVMAMTSAPFFLGSAVLWAALGVRLVPTVMQMSRIVCEPSHWFRWGTMVRKSEVYGNGRKSSEHKGRTFELLLCTSQTWSYV